MAAQDGIAGSRIRSSQPNCPAVPQCGLAHRYSACTPNAIAKVQRFKRARVQGSDRAARGALRSVSAGEHADGGKHRERITRRLLHERRRPAQLSTRSAGAQRSGWRGRVRARLRTANQGLVPLSCRRIPVARFCDALLRQARCRTIDRHVRLRRRQGQHSGLQRSSVRHGCRRRVPARRGPRSIRSASDSRA